MLGKRKPQNMMFDTSFCGHYTPYFVLNLSPASCISLIIRVKKNILLLGQLGFPGAHTTTTHLEQALVFPCAFHAYPYFILKLGVSPSTRGACISLGALKARSQFEYSRPYDIKDLNFS